MRRALLAGAALLLAAAIVGLWAASRPERAVSSSVAVDAAAAPARPSIPVAAAPTPEVPAPVEAPPAPGGGDEDTPAIGLDLERLRSKLPEHSYWKLLAPTEDRELLAYRAERKRELNVLYGKVLSGTGSDEDIRNYFEEKRRISEDAISFASAAIVEVGDELGERERGMLDLAITLHRQRLAELPRRIEEAQARKREQDARREEWLRTGK